MSRPADESSSARLARALRSTAAEGAGKTVARTEPAWRPTSPPSPLSFRTSGFPQYGARPARVGPARACSGQAAPGAPVDRPVCLHPPCAWRERRTPRCVEEHRASRTAVRAISRATPGAPLRSGFCCPGPSSLIRPHPPHSPAPHDFAAPRLIRAALPRRERLGRPRVVPCFRCPLRPDMSPSSTRGVRRLHAPSSFTGDTGLRLLARDSALPSDPPSASSGTAFSRLSWFAPLRPVGCSPPWTDPTELTLGRRRLVRPGFHRVGHPSRCRV